MEAMGWASARGCAWEATRNEAIGVVGRSRSDHWSDGLRRGEQFEHYGYDHCCNDLAYGNSDAYTKPDSDVHRYRK